MTVYDQVKQALQDIVAPELFAIKGEIRRLDERIDALDEKLGAQMKSLDEKLGGQMKSLDEKINTKVDSLRNELLAEIKRVDASIESLQREVRVSLEIRERLSALEARVGISREGRE
jgi:SMC interacting uncharacterized protein involved in chromosome segregation